MRLIKPEDWFPSGIESLEDKADEIVRSQQNNLVVAGPGAGKTELLAQRACYLLQTGTCPPPKRILAISFKKDAAKNLDDRVKLRCGDLAHRFESYTLDAFAKGLVDRFRKAIPDEWRPRSNFEIMVKQPHVREIRDWIERAPLPPDVQDLELQTRRDMYIKTLFEQCVFGHQLPYEEASIPPIEVYLGKLWWRERLDTPVGNPSLSFPMISRLAAYILRSNPIIARALQCTYTYVFLDEFQDTTSSQYDLIHTSFKESNSIMTAVGDSKQRIMLWAGAMPDVLEVFNRDFEAPNNHLVSNYRSAPSLVRMQQVITQAIEPDSPQVVATRDEDTEGICEILEFANSEDEAEYLSNLIEREIRDGGLQPRDLCVLSRQKIAHMIDPLIGALQKKGIRARDESSLQDLLSEPITQVLLNIMRLGSRQRDPDAWSLLTVDIAKLNGWDENIDAPLIENCANELIERCRCAFEDSNDHGQRAETIIQVLVAEIGLGSIRSAYRQYARGSYLSELLLQLTKALEEALNNNRTFREGIDDLIGLDILPAMTIHKSKGLEFHTIIFLGLEDSSWWAFSSQSEEERRNFFVAFSRAMQRVIFTFADVRDDGWGRKSQRRIKIGNLYEILQSAGVPSLNLREEKSPSESF